MNGPTEVGCFLSLSPHVINSVAAILLICCGGVGSFCKSKHKHYDVLECYALFSPQQQTFLHEAALPSPQSTKNLFKKHCNKVRMPPPELCSVINLVKH